VVRMKVLIWDDAEGISGLGDPEYEFDDESYMRLATSEINAVARGLKRAGATSIDVFDGHGMGDNLLLEEMDPEVKYLGGGWMVVLAELIKSEALREYDAVALVGVHPQAGTVDGFIAHTNSGLTALRMNGQPIGEIEQAGWIAGYFGVPLIYAAGDEAAVKEARHFFPDIEAVSVKKKDGDVFVCRPVEDVYKESSEKAFKALNSLREIKPLTCPGPVSVEILLGLEELADRMELLPRYTRKDRRTMVYEAEDYLEAFWAYHGFRPIVSAFVGELYQKVLRRLRDLRGADFESEVIPIWQEEREKAMGKTLPFPEIKF
jgi:D-amino peptidase